MDRYQTSQRQQISPSSPLHCSSSQGRAPQRCLKSIADRPSTVHGSPRRKLVDPNRLLFPVLVRVLFGCCGYSTRLAPFHLFISFRSSSLRYISLEHSLFVPNRLVVFPTIRIIRYRFRHFALLLLCTHFHQLHVYQCPMYSHIISRNLLVCVRSTRVCINATSGLQNLIGDRYRFTHHKVEN